MAKFLLISGAVCLLVSQIYAAPLNEDERKKLSFGARFDPSEVQVVRYENDHNALDNYQFNFALSDDQTREEDARQKNNVRFYVVQGSYSFLGDDGQTHWVHYTADETGYHPRLGTGPDPEKKY
ncbi:conserved hypothetical protein [Culex quinquefasciatus]|uniref:Uncharacterized protein n=1 Tax=Culex quinquefasciatus TaxID=7176 RepID=B0WVF2_CULQU|nr:conserved hypothetical protein [Culex quinquefasciatus]|eukprot:XP_001861374.1 conserved hypothetical protein [Culex quinquefasciatus]